MSSLSAVLCNVIYCKSAYKNGFVFFVCLSMLVVSHFLLKLQIWKISYVNWLNFVYCLKFIRLRPDLNK